MLLGPAISVEAIQFIFQTHAEQHDLLHAELDALAPTARRLEDAKRRVEQASVGVINQSLHREVAFKDLKQKALRAKAVGDEFARIQVAASASANTGSSGWVEKFNAFFARPSVARSLNPKYEKAVTPTLDQVTHAKECVNSPVVANSVRLSMSPQAHERFEGDI